MQRIVMFRKKERAGGVLAAALLLAPAALGQETTGIVREVGPTYHFMVNTKPVPGVVPRVIRGAVFVPLRPVANLTGMSLEWVPGGRAVRIYRGGDRVTLNVGSARAYVNGRGRALARAPIVRDGQTWVSLRTLERLFPDAQVAYNPVTDIAFVNTDRTPRGPNPIRPGFPERPGPNSLREGVVDPLDHTEKRERP